MQKKTGSSPTPKKQPSKISYPKNQGRIYLWLAILAILIFLSLIPSLKGEFLKWDDDWFIQENPQVLNFGLQALPSIFSSFFHGQYSPLTTSLIGIEYAISGGNPFFFRLISILVHLINFFLVFKLASRLLKRQETGLIVAALFGFHTLQVEAIAWISAQKILFYSLFFFLSLLSYLNYLDSGKIKSYLLSILYFVLSFFAKEQAVTLALSIIAIDWFRGRILIDKKLIIEKVPFLLLALIMGIVTIYSSRTGEFFTEKVTSWMAKIVFPAFALDMYFLKIIFPFHLSAFYPYPVDPEGQIPFYYLLYLIPILSILFIVIRKRKNAPVPIFGLLFFIINLFLVLGFLPLRDFVMADRYVYIPAIGLFIIAAHYFGNLYDSKAIIRKNGIYILGIYLFIIAIMTLGRSKVWETSFSLFTDMTEKYPESAVCWNNRGLAAENLQKYDVAEKDFLKAIELKPGFVFAYNNLGIVYTRINKPEKALKALDYALKIRPDFAQAMFNRGEAYSAMGKFPEAINNYDNYLKIRPDNANAWSIRGITKAKSGKMTEGLADLDKSLLINPNNPDSYMNRGVIKLNLKDYPGAITDFSKALERKPNFPYTLFNRGLAYLQSGNGQMACSDLQQAARLGFKQAEPVLAQYCK